MGSGIDKIGGGFLPGDFEGNEHIVAEGETLESVADQHGTTVDSLLRINPGIKGIDSLQAGQRLQIPIVPQTSEPETPEDIIEPFRTDILSTAESFSQKVSPLAIFDSREISFSRQNFDIAEQKVTIRHDGLADFFKMFFTRIVETLAQKAPGEAVAWKPAPGEAVAWKPAPGEAVAWKPAPGEAVAWKPAPGEAIAQEIQPELEPGTLKAVYSDRTFLPGAGDADAGIALPDFDLGVYVSMPGDKAGLFLSPNQFEVDESGGVVVNDDRFSQLLQTTFENKPATDLQSINFAAFQKQKIE
jgi:hypothetical protein